MIPLDLVPIVCHGELGHPDGTEMADPSLREVSPQERHHMVRGKTDLGPPLESLSPASWEGALQKNIQKWFGRTYVGRNDLADRR